MVLEVPAFNTIKVFGLVKEISQIGDMSVNLLLDVDEFLWDQRSYDDCHLLIECKFKKPEDDDESSLYEARILFPFGGKESYKIEDLLFYFDLELESEIVDELFYNRNLELVKILSPDLSILSFDETMANFKNIIRYLIYRVNPIIKDEVFSYEYLSKLSIIDGRLLLASWSIKKDNIEVNTFSEN